MERRTEGGAFGLIVGTQVDSIVDGMLIGIGYAADPSLGILLAAGFAAEKFTTSMTLAAEMRANGRSRRAIVLWICIIAATLVPAGVMGMTLLADPSSRAHTFLLSMTAAALIYIVTTELIARGQRTHDTTTTVAVFFAGYIALASYAVLSGA
ncbi:MAG: hypothetical protein FJ335_02060 [Sphingomonadales bacterium]|nr:hypothetical protein [Sphingomonadales bacterium]